MSKFNKKKIPQDMANVFYKFPKSPFVGFASPFLSPNCKKLPQKNIDVDYVYIDQLCN